MFHEPAAERFGGFQPIGILRQEYAAGPCAEDPRIVDTWGDNALFGQGMGGQQEPPPHANDHHVAAGQVLARSVSM